MAISSFVTAMEVCAVGITTRRLEVIIAPSVREFLSKLVSTPPKRVVSLSVSENNSTSHPLHKAVHHLLLPGLIERDGELVALDLHNVAVAEFLVEHTVADRIGRDRPGRFRHQFAFDCHRAAPTGSATIP